MALYTKVNFGPDMPLSLDEYKSSLWDSVKSSFGMGMDMNPMQSLDYMYKANDVDTDFVDVGTNDLDAVDVAERTIVRKDAPLDMAAQERMIEEEGLTGQVKPHERYSREALQIIIDHKKMENQSAFISEHAPGWHTPFGFVTGLGASFLDPINLASAFVPVAPRAWSMTLLRGAGSSLGKRAWAKARIGAFQGAVGSAMLEPLIAGGQLEVQADYGMANSLLNIGFGAVMGAVLHSVPGYFRDRYSKKNNLPFSEEYVPTSEESEEYRTAFENAYIEEMRKTRPDIDEAELINSARDLAALYDARARNWAYNEQKPIADYWRRWGVNFRAGIDGVETGATGSGLTAPVAPEAWRALVPDELRQRLGTELDEALKLDFDGFRAKVDEWISRNPDDVAVAQLATELDNWRANAGNIAPEVLQQSKIVQEPTGPIMHENVNTVGDLYYLAREAQPAFTEAIKDIGNETGGEAHFRPGEGLKSPERVQRKIDQDYPEDGAKRVLDVLGATLLYHSKSEVEAALPVITQKIEASGGKVIRIKNRFDKPSAGYKDYLVNIRMKNGFVTELLLTTKAMSEAKEGAAGVGHYIYEAMQTAESVWNNENATPIQKEEAWAYLRQLRKASEEYYGSTGAESNDTASLSVIVEPLNMISATGALYAGSKLYPKVEALLGNIRNKPDFAITKGLSSYSTNSSINTGSLEVPVSQGVPSKASLPSENIVRKGLAEDGITKPPVDENNITQANGRGNISEKKSGEILHQSPASRTSAVAGSPTRILGQNTSDAAHYEVWELDDIIPSHDPNNYFERRKDYPAIAQERPYHSDPGEQEKVRGNALAYNPDFVVNTDPTAGNGPPVITKDGIVLGGNSRAMTLSLLYGMDKAQGYRDILANRAPMFGLDANAIASMQRPVLVRVLDGNLDMEGMARKSREYNQTTTQRLQGLAEAVSRGRLFSDDTLAKIAKGLDEYEGLGDFLNHSRDIVDDLLMDGVIQKTEYASYTSNDGRLNDEGKLLVTRALRGLAVPDYDVLSSLPSKIAAKIDRIVPAMTMLRAKGGIWDLSHSLVEALRLVKEAAIGGKKLDVWLGQAEMYSPNPFRNDPLIQAMALTMDRASPVEAKTRFEIFANEAAKADDSQVGLFGARNSVTPEKAFADAFFTPVATVDGLAVGNFNPQKSELHAALAWAKQHGGGKNATAAKALIALGKKLQSKKLTSEQKAELIKIQGDLANFVGRINIFEPNLGNYYRIPEQTSIRVPKPSTEVHERAVPSQVTAKPASPSDAPSQSISQPDKARAQVQFMEDGRAIITFFKSADLTSAPHELYHVIRRQMEEAANDLGASERTKELWRRTEEFVGAKPGEKWTVEMEEKFARAGERYLMEGKAPSASLIPVFERMKKWFMDVYKDATEAGLEISDNMRRTFDDMFALPFEQGYMEFRRAVGDIVSREWEREVEPLVPDETDARLETAEKQGDLAAVQELQNDSAARLQEAMDNVSALVDKEFLQEIHNRPQENGLSGAELLAQAEKDISLAEQKGKWMEDLLACQAQFGG